MKKENGMMKSKQWDLVLLLGVLCFVVGAALMVFDYQGNSWQYALPVLGLILIGAGASGKRRVS
jgi:uncharacterized membrane protein HdeD (DUF308 family)